MRYARRRILLEWRLLSSIKAIASPGDTTVEGAVDNLDGRFLVFRATKMMAAETECRDLDTCFAEISKRNGHVTPSQSLLGPVTNSLNAFTMPKRAKCKCLVTAAYGRSQFVTSKKDVSKTPPLLSRCRLTLLAFFAEIRIFAESRHFDSVTSQTLAFASFLALRMLSD